MQMLRRMNEVCENVLCTIGEYFPLLFIGSVIAFIVILIILQRMP